MKKRVWEYVRDSKAVSALEYAILVGVIAVGVGMAVMTFSGDITNAVEGIGDKVNQTDEKAGTVPDLDPGS